MGQRYIQNKRIFAVKFNLHYPLSSVYSRDWKDIEFEVQNGKIIKREQDELPKKIEEWAIKIARSEVREGVQRVMAMPTEYGTLSWRDILL